MGAIAIGVVFEQDTRQVDRSTTQWHTVFLTH